MFPNSMQINKFARIAVGWTICTTLGIYLFYVSKTSIDKKRYENMKVRERMRLANFGEYEPPTRYTGKS